MTQTAIELTDQTTHEYQRLLSDTHLMWEQHKSYLKENLPAEFHGMVDAIHVEVVTVHHHEAINAHDVRTIVNYPDELYDLLRRPEYLHLSLADGAVIEAETSLNVATA